MDPDDARGKTPCALFDPKTATDKATYKAGENGLPSTGIPNAIVHGTVVVEDSNVLPVKAGQPIRYPVEEKGRFQPAGVAKWINNHTILSTPYAPMPDDTGAGTELKKLSGYCHRRLSWPNSSRWTVT